MLQIQAALSIRGLTTYGEDGGMVIHSQSMLNATGFTDFVEVLL